MKRYYEKKDYNSVGYADKVLNNPKLMIAKVMRKITARSANANWR
jgi:hypothetical protein